MKGIILKIVLFMFVINNLFSAELIKNMVFKSCIKRNIESIGNYSIIYKNDIPYIGIEDFIEVFKKIRFPELKVIYRDEKYILENNSEYKSVINIKDNEIITEFNGKKRYVNLAKFNEEIFHFDNSFYIPIYLLSVSINMDDFQYYEGKESFVIFDYESFFDEIMVANTEERNIIPIDPYSGKQMFEKRLTKNLALKNLNYLKNIIEIEYPDSSINKKIIGSKYEEFQSKIEAINETDVKREEKYRRIFDDYLLLLDDHHSLYFSRKYRKYKEAGIKINIIDVECKEIDNNVGYMRIPIMGTTMAQNKLYSEYITKIRNSFEKLSGKKWIIVDIRDNPGGWLGISDEILKYLLKNENVEFETWDRGFKEKYSIYGNGKIINNQKIIIVINSNTYSAANSIAATAKDKKLAIIVGEKSKGGAYGPNNYIMIANDIVQIGVRCRYEIDTKKDYEQGVEPDVYTDDDWEEIYKKIQEIIEKNGI